MNGWGITAEARHQQALVEIIGVCYFHLRREKLPVQTLPLIVLIMFCCAAIVDSHLDWTIFSAQTISEASEVVVPLRPCQITFTDGCIMNFVKPFFFWIRTASYNLNSGDVWSTFTASVLLSYDTVWWLLPVSRHTSNVAFSDSVHMFWRW